MLASSADRNSTEQEYSTLFFQEVQTPQKLVARRESHMKDTYLLFLVVLEAATGAPGWKPQTGLSEEMKGLKVCPNFWLMRVSRFCVKVCSVE